MILNSAGRRSVIGFVRSRPRQKEILKGTTYTSARKTGGAVACTVGGALHATATLKIIGNIINDQEAPRVFQPEYFPPC